MDEIQHQRLTEFYNDMLAAQARYEGSQRQLQMMQQSMQGAQNDVVLREARFKAAVEFIGGPTATWSFNPDDGVSVIVPDATAPPPAEPPAELANGEIVPLPRQARRKLARDEIVPLPRQARRKLARDVARQIAKPPK